MAQNNFYIPKRPEVKTVNHFSGTVGPKVSGFRNPPSGAQHSSVIYGPPSPLPPRSPAPVLERYPPATLEAPYAQNGPMRRSGVTQAPPPSPSAYYRHEQPPGRNFLTLPINRSTSRTPLPLSGEHRTAPTSNYRSAPNSPQPPKAPPSYYRTYSHSPFATGHRSAPTLDKYPSVLTLNEVKLTPLPGLRIERYSTSAIPTVLDRYPPAAGDPYYQKVANRNSAPVPGQRSNPNSVPPSPSSKKKKEKSPTVDDNFVPNRFRYPTTPTGTLNRAPQSLNFAIVSQREMDYSPTEYQPQPPPPPPIIQPTQIRVPQVPAIPKRAPSNASTLVRRPSLKVKRSASTASNHKVTPPQPPVPRRKAPPPNHSSRLLSQEENKLVFEILGHGRQTLSTAIVQHLLPDECEDYEVWSEEGVNVLCFVRDSAKKSYFLEFISLLDGCSNYAYEIYEEFNYKTKRNTKFLSFESERSLVGVNFADETEFLHFKDTLDKKIESKRQRRHDRESKHLDSVGQSSTQNGTDATWSSTLHQLKEPKKKYFTFGRRSAAPKAQKDKSKGKKLDKRDIGTPSNFTHVSHAGFDPQHGFQSYGDIDISKYQELFQKAEISEQELNDPATRKFIYEFVENYEKETVAVAPPPPPPPPMQNHMVSPSPPPPPRLNPPRQEFRIPHEPEPDYHEPPKQQHRAPPPPPARSDRSPKVAPPPPPMTLPIQAPRSIPPPPPPPMPSTENATSRSRGQEVNSPEPFIPEADYDARSNLLREIQESSKGRLKPVDDSFRTGSTSPMGNPMDGLAGALQRALADRSRAINPDSSDSDSDAEAFDSEDWEDD